jgi:plasmid stability protein
MAAITIRRLDEGLKARLRSARHGRSMEEEAREILKAALTTEAAERPNLAEAIRRIIAPSGGVDLPAAKREHIRRPPQFTK